MSQKGEIKPFSDAFIVKFGESKVPVVYKTDKGP